MALKLSNNAISRLASAVSVGATSISVATGEGAKFPTLGAGDYFPATLSKPDGSYEIVNVTARSGDTLTAVRAREGTTALAFDANTLIELRLTAFTIEAITTKLDGIAAGATNVTDTSQLTNGAGFVTSSGSVTYATSAGSVTNGVYTTGDQTIGGNKTFSSAPTLGAGAKFSASGWSVTETSTKLYFAFNGVNKASLDSSGNLIVAGNVTAYGTV